MQNEIYFAAGCFWGAEKYFKLVEGVLDTTVGFANGNTVAPSYKEVYTDTTGHAETVKIVFDPEKISLYMLTKLFLMAIDPLSLNKQGEDEGTRYRTGVYFVNEGQVPQIRQALDEKAAELGQELAVEFEPLRCFYSAEEYHQDYLAKNPGGYCHLPVELYEYVKSGAYLNQ